MVELTYLHVVVKRESLLGGQGKARRTVTLVSTNQVSRNSGLELVSRKSRNISVRILGDIILFVSSKQRRLEARNFQVILFALQHSESEFYEWLFGTFEKRVPELLSVFT